jgi:hypothetical protein
MPFDCLQILEQGQGSLYQTVTSVNVALRAKYLAAEFIWNLAISSANFRHLSDDAPAMLGFDGDTALTTFHAVDPLIVS